MLTNTDRIFLASANTTQGFSNHFSEVFNPNLLQAIYIIKGGPGTGKSCLMRSLANQAQERGFTVDQFLCSSDPKSLDGVLIREKNVAILDGTSPHTTDPKYPGVVENIVNTGAFWDKSILLKQKGNIIRSIQEKNRYYRRAYRFLKAAGEIDNEIYRIGESALIPDKMKHSIERLSGKFLKKGSGFYEETRLTSTVNLRGVIRLDSFEKLSNDIYLIEDIAFTSYHYLQMIYEKAIVAEQEVWKSYSPLFPELLDALYFPRLKCSFVIGEKDYDSEDNSKNYHYINMQRFVDKEKITNNRQKIRFGRKCTEMLINGAVDAFHEASKAHSQLEEIYIEAMDFEKLSAMSTSLIEEILNG